MLCAMSGLLACSQHVQIRTEEAPAELWIDGERVGQTTRGKLAAEIPPGMEDVPFEIRRKSEIVRGVIPRSEPNIPWVVTTVLATACCVPSLAATGFCVANPAMWLAALGGCASVNPSLCLSVASFSPTWWTLPVAIGGVVCGTSPLFSNLWASQVPDVVDLSKHTTEVTHNADRTAPAAQREKQEVVVPDARFGARPRNKRELASVSETEPLPW